MPTVSRTILPVELDLSLYARALVELSGEAPAPWTNRFLAEVRLIRNHLTPISSRALLASSFDRESFGRPEGLTAELAAERLRASAVHVAYATRWLELAEPEEPRRALSLSRPTGDRPARTRRGRGGRSGRPASRRSGRA